MGPGKWSSATSLVHWFLYYPCRSTNHDKSAPTQKTFVTKTSDEVLSICDAYDIDANNIVFHNSSYTSEIKNNATINLSNKNFPKNVPTTIPAKNVNNPPKKLAFLFIFF